MSDWNATRLGDCISVQGGYAFSSEFFQDSGIPLARISNIVNQKIVDKSPIYLPSEFLEIYGDYAASENDSLIAMSGATTGKTALVMAKDLPFLINQRVGRFLIKDGNRIDRLFLFYLVNYEEVQTQVLIDAVGGAQPNISSNDIERIVLSLPPLEQQQKIAKILSTVDNLIEKTQTLIDKYTAIKQGMMADLFTRGIDMTTGDTPNSKGGKLRPSVEDAPELYKQTELGWVPKEWEVCSIEGVSLGGFKNGYFKDPRLVGDGMKLINVSELYQDYGIDITTEKVERIKVSRKDYEKYKVEIGDIFFTRSSLVLEGIAKSNIVRVLPEEAVFECHVMRLKPDQSQVVPEYLAIYTGLPAARNYLMSMAKQVTMTTISQPDMVGLPVPVPPIEEQSKVIQRLNAIEELIVKENAEMQKNRAIKKGLMQDLLTGKVRV